MSNDHLISPDLAAKADQIARIWKDILHVPEGQADATFFELQGQSISAVRIAARIEDELDLVVDVGILFEDPNLETFTSRVLDGAVPAEGAAVTE